MKKLILIITAVFSLSLQAATNIFHKSTGDTNELTRLLKQSTEGASVRNIGFDAVSRLLTEEDDSEFGDTVLHKALREGNRDGFHLLAQYVPLRQLQTVVNGQGETLSALATSLHLILREVLPLTAFPTPPQSADIQTEKSSPEAVARIASPPPMPETAKELAAKRSRSKLQQPRPHQQQRYSPQVRIVRERDLENIVNETDQDQILQVEGQENPYTLPANPPQPNYDEIPVAIGRKSSLAKFFGKVNQKLQDLPLKKRYKANPQPQTPMSQVRRRSESQPPLPIPAPQIARRRSVSQPPLPITRSLSEEEALIERQRSRSSLGGTPPPVPYRPFSPQITTLPNPFVERQRSRSLHTLHESQEANADAPPVPERLHRPNPAWPTEDDEIYEVPVVRDQEASIAGPDFEEEITLEQERILSEFL